MDTQKISNPQPAIKDIAGDTAAVTRKHLAKNVVANAVFLGFNAASSLIVTPFVILHLGMPVYAMVYIAYSFVNYLGVITTAVAGSTGRFVGLEVSRGNNDSARSYLSTQLTTAVWTIAALAPITVVVAVLSPRFLNIPAGQEANTQLLLGFVSASVLVGVLASPFRVTAFVTQRFDVSNLIEVGNQAVRYGTWVVLFLVVTPKLWQIGLGYLLGTVVLLISFVVAFRRLTPWLWPRFGSFDARRFLESAKMSGWMSLAQAGMVLCFYIDGIVILQYVGADNCGKYGTIALLVGQLRVMSGMLMYTLAMPLISCCAAGEWQRLMLNTARAVRYLALILALLLGVFCGLSKPFVICWLGPQFVGLSLLIWLMTSHLVINMGMDPTSSAMYAANRMCVPAIATVIGGGLKLVLALVLITHTTWGIYSLIVADIIAMTVKNQIFAPLYMAKITKSSCLPIYKALVPPVLTFGMTSSVCYLLSRAIDFGGMQRVPATGVLVVVSAALLAGFGALAYRFALNKSDREFFRQASPWKRKSTEAAGA